MIKNAILLGLAVVFVFAFPYSKTTSRYLSTNHIVYLPLVQNEKSPADESCKSPTCYYLDSQDGSDSNPGTAPDRAWRTLTKLNSASLQPGMTVFLKRGSLWTGRAVLRSSGQAGKPITIRAYGEGDAPVLANPADTGNEEAVLSLWGGYYVVDGLDIHDSGIGINLWSNHNIIQNSEISDVAAGIDIHGQYNLITHNYVHDTRMVVDTLVPDWDDWGANGITIDNSHNEISYNEFENCEAHSYDFRMAGGALEIYQNGDYTSIHHNRSLNSEGFIEVSGNGSGSAANVTMAYNLVINSTHFSYIHLDSNNGVRASNFRIENNTLVDLRRHDSMIGNFIGFDGSPTSDTYSLINNIIYISDYWNVFSTQFTHHNNIYYLMNSSTKVTLGSNEYKVNPQFEDLADHDFHLKATSPAIDKGVSLGYSSDFDGLPVPAGKLPDLGAFEFPAE